MLASRTTPEEGPLGMIDLRPGPHGVSFGYVLARARWGAGLMPEALAALVGRAPAQPGVSRAYAFCDAESAASARVMAKAGMAFEGVLRRWLAAPNTGPEPRDCLIYARVRRAGAAGLGLRRGRRRA